MRRPGQRGRQKAATKQLVSLRLSQEVLEYFKATGPGWQTRIDESLKEVSKQPEGLKESLKLMERLKEVSKQMEGLKEMLNQAAGKKRK